MSFFLFVLGCWVGCIGGLFLTGVRSRPAARTQTDMSF